MNDYQEDGRGNGDYTDADVEWLNDWVAAYGFGRDHGLTDTEARRHANEIMTDPPTDGIDVVEHDVHHVDISTTRPGWVAAWERYGRHIHASTSILRGVEYDDHDILPDPYGHGLDRGVTS